MLASLLTETQDAMAPAQFIAGWAFGISNQSLDLRDAIVQCYTTNDDLTATYYDAQAAFATGDFETGHQKLSDAKQYYDAAFANCSTDVTAPLTTWSNMIDAL